jgi:predicted transcriptional regulator
MKTAITVRLDPNLLEAVRIGAERENRTLTNFIATALKERLQSDLEQPDHVGSRRSSQRDNS